MRYLWDNGGDVLISIHALLAESDGVTELAQDFTLISIHALLAESDLFHLFYWLFFFISIHALLAESDSVVSGKV